MAKKPTPAVTKEPEKTKIFTIGGQPHEVTMSFGLLSLLARGVGDAHGAMMTSVDNDLREFVVVSILAKRDKKGMILEDGEFSFFESGITADEALAIAGWAGEHLLPFFLKTMELTAKSMEENKDVLEELKSRTSTLIGSEV